MSPEPGWYEDPEDARYLRYWDGADWTDLRDVAAEAKQLTRTTPPMSAAHTSRLRRVGWYVMAAAIGAVLTATVVLPLSHGSSHGGAETAASTASPIAATTTIGVDDTAPNVTDSSVAETTTTDTTAPALSPDVQDAVQIAQEWATALAKHDWETAKSFRPETASTTDAQFEHGYGGLHESTVVYVSGDVGDLHVASVAHEASGNARHTTVWCFRLAVTTGASTLAVLEQHSVSPQVHGWVGASIVGDQIAAC